MTVQIGTADATAIADADYTAALETLSWADGDDADKTFTVTIIEDLQIEGAETFAVTLREPSTGVELRRSEVTINIIDDDRLGDTFALTSAGRLVTFDRAAPGTLTSAADVSGLATDEDILGIDVRPANGLVYAITDANELYTMDPATGVATFKSSLVADTGDTTNAFSAITGTVLGIDFNPLVDRLRVVSDTGENLRINVDTGSTITDAALNGAVTGNVSVAYRNSVAVACRTALFALDPGTDRLLLQNPPNDGTTSVVGSFGVDASAIAGFDIVTDAAGVHTALATLTVGGVTGLYTINLTTGAATLAAAIGVTAGETVHSFTVSSLPATSAVAQAPGELYGVTESSRLVSFNRVSPNKLCTSTAITGITAGDDVVGFDVRPSTGVLYALTKNSGTGKLYSIDPATAVASSPVTLTAALTGTRFGIDFNPTGVVALRIVSNTGQNLRVTDVTTGATTADSALNGAATGAVGAGYTDAVPGAGTTTLYVLDTAADRLRIQNPPNAGTLVDVGAFGVDVGDVVTFDIDGRDNTAFIAVGGTTTSTLHTINLSTGAASASLGTIGGDSRLLGIARLTPATTVFGLTIGNALVRVSLTDPSTVIQVGPVTGLASGEDLLGIDIRPSTGVLHGLGDLGGVYTIDPTTAVATKLGNLSADSTDTTPFAALAGNEFGIDFNPTGPVALRVVSDAEQNLRIPNVTSPATFSDFALSRATRMYTVAGAAYANNIPSAPTTTLYAIDTENDKLVTIVPPNNGFVREIGNLGVDATASTMFEIAGPATAIAVVQGGTGKSLATIDLTTGAATSVGAVGLAGTLVGLAAPATATTPAADSVVYVMNDANVLASFARNAPGAVTTIGTALFGTSETVVGMDVRPSTNELWVLTRTASGVGRLYSINTTNAIATLRSTLVPDVGDSTSPYSMLSGTSFAIDFNPTGVVALRVISDTGQNLRIVDPATGATFTDAAIGMPTAIDATAAAYTNSFVAPTGVTPTTALYVIDVTAGSLMIQSPPNGGVLTPVGALSPSLSFADATMPSATAFDIGGGNNGIALAALQHPTSTPGTLETFSHLYRINLATGAATEVGAAIGGAPLRGLAIQVR